MVYNGRMTSAFKDDIEEFAIDGGTLAIGDALWPLEGVQVVTGDGHFKCKIEAGDYGSVRRIVIEREDYA